MGVVVVIEVLGLLEGSGKQHVFKNQFCLQSSCGCFE